MAIPYLARLLAFGALATAIPLYKKDLANPTCRKTKVAVLGAGVAGITAAVGLIEHAPAIGLPLIVS